MRDLYFGHPAYDRRMGSLVHLQANGAIDGFIGAFPQPLLLHGRRLQGVITGSFMVEDPAANPITGARLVRSLLNGPQDVTIADTANRCSLDFQRVLGCETFDLQSLQWTKILKARELCAVAPRHQVGQPPDLAGHWPMQSIMPPPTEGKGR